MPASRDPVLRFTDRGLYCPAGDFHIDPWRPVARAVVTHAHSDHARPGMGHYLATPRSLAAMRHRLGPISAAPLRFGERLRIGAAEVSLHPAGHLPGAAQVRIAVAGEVWVVSGDYKTTGDGLSEPFEPVPCHCFISECTFGLPIFRWPPEAELRAGIGQWWADCQAEGRPALIGAYSLGKAQRVLAALDPEQGPILTHGAVEEMTAILRAEGVALPPTQRVTPDLALRALPGAVILAPPAALGTPWARRFGPDTAEAFASGWMQLRGIRRRRGLEKGFVISDHADWDGLNAAIRATGAERIFVTHGYVQPFRRWLETQGYDAGIVNTGWQGEADADEVTTAEKTADETTDMTEGRR